MLRYSFLLLAVLFLTNCAHFRTSTVKILEEPDYYVGKKLAPQKQTASVPIYIRQWRSPLNQSLRAALQKLQSKMNQYLKSKSTIKMVPTIQINKNEYPIVYFGIAESFDFPGDANSPEFNEYSKEEKPLLVMYQESPSKKWKDALKPVCSSNKIQYLIVPFLSIGDVKVFQKDWKGNKEVVLGTDYRQSVPWLTALDQPVEMLYVGAAVVNCQGKILRAGAEGMLAKRTNFALSVFNVQASLQAKDVLKLIKSRRDDLPDKPFVWQAAIDNLLKRLTK